MCAPRRMQRLRSSAPRGSRPSTGRAPTPARPGATTDNRRGSRARSPPPRRRALQCGEELAADGRPCGHAINRRPQRKGVRMAGKVLVSLTTGMEDPEQVTLAFLVATAGLEQGKTVVIWATKEAVRLGLPGVAQGEACDG